MNKRALICGISGQDGAYLAKFLLEKGYEVYGTSRDASINAFANLTRLGVANNVMTMSMVQSDFRSIIQAISVSDPHEIYNLAGQSSVDISFQQPIETLDSIAVGTFNMLEAIRLSGKAIKYYGAGSSECFGDQGKEPSNEQTAFMPRSPYATAKAAAYWAVANYRESYGLKACTGILFNHESPLRPARFVTQKIVIGACEIAAERAGELHLGDTTICRDWGWAPEYVEAMWLMLQMDTPEDLVIATGQSSTIWQFCETVFDHLGLDAKDFIRTDPTLRRPSDIHFNAGDARKAQAKIGWNAKYKMPDVARMMVDAQLSNGADQ